MNKDESWRDYFLLYFITQEQPGLKWKLPPNLAYVSSWRVNSEKFNMSELFHTLLLWTKWKIIQSGRLFVLRRMTYSRVNKSCNMKDWEQLTMIVRKSLMVSIMDFNHKTRHYSIFRGSVARIPLFASILLKGTNASSLHCLPTQPINTVHHQYSASTLPHFISHL